MTEKLYYEDSHIKDFTARVLSSEMTADGLYAAVLDKTAFFPGGGGQAPDTGRIGDGEVSDVWEKNEVIYHKVTVPLSQGESVKCHVDWDIRFARMQRHSGEHIVSGLVRGLFGFNNVGFHMGSDAVTADYDGVIPKDRLRELERLANRAVTSDLRVEAYFPSDKEASEADYRSKTKITEGLRLVKIPGVDLCACCAPHVKRTGEIGVIKLIRSQRYKGGTRVSMLCGSEALRDYAHKAELIESLTQLLSANEDALLSETRRLTDEIEGQKRQILSLHEKLWEYKTDADAAQTVRFLFDDTDDPDAARRMMNLLLSKGAGIAAAFAGNDADGYRYCIGCRQTGFETDSRESAFGLNESRASTLDMRVIAKRLGEKFSGKGGGAPEMVRGAVTGKSRDIMTEVLSCVKTV